MKLTRFIPIIAAIGIVASLAIAQVEIVRGSPPLTRFSASTSGIIPNVAGYGVIDAGLILTGNNSPVGATAFVKNTNLNTGFIFSGDSSLVYSNAVLGLTVAAPDISVAGAVTTGVASGNGAVKITTGSFICLVTGSCASGTLSWNGTAVTTPGKFLVGDDLNVTADGFIRSLSLTGSGTTGQAGITKGGNAWLSQRIPTLTGNWCTTPVVTGTMTGFNLAVGTACTGKQGGTITSAGSANTSWVCSCQNLTSRATLSCRYSGGSSTTATFESFTTATGVAADFNDNDNLRISCIGY